MVYFLFILILLAACGTGFKRVWTQCEEYQQSSADTLVDAALKSENDKTGLELECSMIPVVREDGISVYTFVHGDEDVAEVKIATVSKGIFGLAMCRQEGVEYIGKCRVVAPKDCVIDAGEGSKISCTEEEIIFCGMDDLQGKLKNTQIPVYTAYEIAGFPSMSSVKLNLAGVPLSLIPQEDGSYIAFELITGDEAAAMNDRAAELLEKYSFFFGNDITWDNLEKHVCENVPLGDKLQALDTFWFTKHTKSYMENIMLSDPVRLSPEFVMIDTASTYTVVKKSDGLPSSYSADLCLVLHLDRDGVWRLAELGSTVRYNNDLKPYEGNAVTKK